MSKPSTTCISDVSLCLHVIKQIDLYSDWSHCTLKLIPQNALVIIIKKMNVHIFKRWIFFLSSININQIEMEGYKFAASDVIQKLKGKNDYTKVFFSGPKAHAHLKLRTVLLKQIIYFISCHGGRDCVSEFLQYIRSSQKIFSS